MWNSPIFVTVVTRVGPVKIWMAPLIRPSPKTPFGANSAAVAFVQAELWPIWVENGQIFGTMATRVGPGKIWIAPLNRQSPKTPCSVQTRRLYHLYQQSYGRFGSKIQNSISQRIFNQSSTHFTPHWSLAVAIQSRCWNYPTTSRFGQTRDKKFRVDFKFDLKK